MRTYNKLSNKSIYKIKLSHEFVATNNSLGWFYVLSQYKKGMYDFRRIRMDNTEQFQKLETFCILNNIPYYICYSTSENDKVSQERDTYLYSKFPGLYFHKKFEIIDY